MLSEIILRCERVYSPWPDLDKIMREKNIPLFTDDRQRSLAKQQEIVDKVETFDDFTKYTCSYSMRLEAPKGLEKYTYDIDNKKKYTFSFLSDVIPDPRAVFFIEGSRYVCEKITATFQESTGKSQLLKGVFYRII